MTAVARRFLTAEQVQNLHRLYVNPTGEGTAALLDSAVQSPINHKHYEGENDMVNLAALLATKLIKNHPFGDGNIRAALIAANAFLSMNGKMIQRSLSIQLTERSTLHWQIFMFKLPRGSVMRNGWRRCIARS